VVANQNRGRINEETDNAVAATAKNISRGQAPESGNRGDAE
jgi:hypothetical protein